MKIRELFHSTALSQASCQVSLLRISMTLGQERLREPRTRLSALFHALCRGQRVGGQGGVAPYGSRWGG